MNKKYTVYPVYFDTPDGEIIIPIQSNGKGLYNNKYIEENQIKSVYGRNNLQNYLIMNNFEQIYKKKHLP